MFITSLLQAVATEPVTEPASPEINLVVWKWVIIIGVAAIVAFYVIKRVADVAVKKKTDDMIRSVEDDDK